MKYLIYKLTSPDNKIYIGQTCRTLEERLKDGYTGELAKDMKKYDFYKEILVDNLNAEQANLLEDYYINKYDSITSGYNKYHNRENYVPTSEERKRISERTKEGMKKYRERIGEEELSRRNKYAATFSNHQKAAQSLKKRYQTKTEDEKRAWRDAIRRAQNNPKAICKSEEFRKKMSILAKQQAAEGRTSKGCRWWTNGVISLRAYTCPEGFKSGRHKRSKV